MSRPGGMAERNDVRTSAVGTRGAPEDALLRNEWEKVRRQRKALEDKQKRGGNDAKSSLKADDDDDDDAEQQWLMAAQAQPTTDPFACLCRCNLQKLGQSYILRERRVLRQGRVKRELVLVGPHWIGVCVTLGIIVGCTAMFLHQQCTLMPWYYSLITLGFCCMTLYYLYGVACVDPGIVFPPRRLQTSDEMKETIVTVASDDEDDSIGDGNASEEGQARVRAAVSPLRPSPDRFSPRTRYCDVCEITQDAYTEHCDDCGVCIEDYDHHCPWMGKCIGKNNMYAFKMFNLSWVLYVVFVLGVSIQNVDWGDAAVQRLHRLSTGEWVPMGKATPVPGPQ